MWTSGKFKRYSIDSIADPVHGGMANWLHANKTLIKDVVGSEILISGEIGAKANRDCVRFQGSCSSLPSIYAKPIVRKKNSVLRPRYISCYLSMLPC